MLSMVRSYLVGEQEEWDQHLACLAAAYRSTPHDSNKLFRNLLALGREVRMPASSTVMLTHHRSKRILASMSYDRRKGC
ncbi:hypothetical protein DPMN_136286 [Dreissena polymorpha]|uniref:Uncharacterized protein n=1 Tax=Dreissena polymorpha TaxID=45954 RepID=A0A9D4FZQ2_DREPO|nr:hypothetical protein DPMN_136284 [Dreissena polymorpha]KAH3807938.1 hypothetical protein DPMN_136286 [Dreissena polymorpha]